MPRLVYSLFYEDDEGEHEIRIATAWDGTDTSPIIERCYDDNTEVAVFEEAPPCDSEDDQARAAEILEYCLLIRLADRAIKAGFHPPIGKKD